ncbi:MAG: hypothetical protein J0L93_11260 [Deltaproteobacteria bacterium]|nr:hypothetical protein [Deltaproteobacteria bacterium]
MFASLLFLSLLSAPTEPQLDYGDVYFQETQSRQAPFLHLSLGYGAGLSNSFLHMDSVVGTAQMRVWKYLSTGILGQVIRSQYTDAGRALDSLSRVDILADVPTPLWGIFSLSYLQLMIGKWNVLNLFPLEVDLLLGGGAGTTRKQGSINSAARSYFSYLWSVEQRLRFLSSQNSSLGLTISVFGHRDGVFLQPALSYSFE